jgi:lipid II:glycine glycyltransferase (peptidoglycan interpeptide bridge formation enzyme)
VLKLNNKIVAIALVRIKKLPLLGLGIAYVYWGPLWRKVAAPPTPENFRQAVRALRNEFTAKRGLPLRLFPFAFRDDPDCLGEILSEEGFLPLHEQARRTILMDLTPSTEEHRKAMNSHWRGNLRSAENKGLECIDGTSEELFARIGDIYQQTVSRKHFAASNNIRQYMQIQARLPEKLKMRAMLCQSGADLCAGMIYSIIGESAIFLLAATGDQGLKNRASYLLWWKTAESMKLRGATSCNLNGINPETNPGTYRFKRDLSAHQGRDLVYITKYDAYPNHRIQWLVRFAEASKKTLGALKKRIVKLRATPPHPQAPSKTPAGESSTHGN